MKWKADSRAINRLVLAIALVGILAMSTVMTGDNTTRADADDLINVGVKQLTTFADPNSRASHPIYNPEGTKIVFNYAPTFLRFDIWVMNADGSGQTRLTFNSDTNEKPRWSPDGTKILFVRGPLYGNTEIWVMDADGSNQVPLTNTPFREYGPSWSPDGQEIAFLSYESGDEDIWIMNADGTNKEQITSNMDCRGTMVWSPDGSRIAFTSNINGNYDIFVIDIDGSNLTQLTTDSVMDLQPEWSPDGWMIAYTSKSAGNDDVWVMNSDGTNKTNLTTYDGIDAYAFWSPQGNKLAFSSDRDGVQNIWEMAIRVRGPRDLKNDAIAELEAIRPFVNEKVREDIDEAIESIIESLSPEYWLDETHLHPVEGKEVFDEEEDAAEELMEILEEDKEDGVTNQTIRDEILDVILRLVKADEMLAQVAIEEAIENGGNPEDIREALEAMQQAEKAISEGRYDDAIEYYEEAWEAAMESME